MHYLPGPPLVGFFFFFFSFGDRFSSAKERHSFDTFFVLSHSFFPLGPCSACVFFSASMDVRPPFFLRNDLPVGCLLFPFFSRWTRFGVVFLCGHLFFCCPCNTQLRYISQVGFCDSEAAVLERHDSHGRLTLFPGPLVSTRSRALTLLTLGTSRFLLFDDFVPPGLCFYWPNAFFEGSRVNGFDCFH